MELGTLSPDGKYVWDGAEWRQLSPDGAWWWDGKEWRAVAGSPMAPQVNQDGHADGEPINGDNGDPLSDIPETAADLQGVKADVDEPDVEVEAPPEAGYRVSSMGLVVSPAGEWWWNGSKWHDLVKKPKEPRPNAKGPKFGFGQAMQMVSTAVEMKKAIAQKGSVQAVEASLQTLTDDRKPLFQSLHATCPLPLDPGMPRLPGGLELFPDEFLATTAKDWGWSSQRLTVTTHRIIYTRGRVSKLVESMYLQDVRDVKYIARFMQLPMIGLESAAGVASLEGLPGLSPSKAQKVRNDILAMVHFARQRAQAAATPTPTAAVAPEDVSGKLKQLAELRSAGIVNEEEFQAKKTELLKRL